MSAIVDIVLAPPWPIRQGALMHLTRAERWILSNQLRILEVLCPDEAKGLSEQRVGLERGYELHYEWLCTHIYNDDQAMTADECREIVDIFEMFSALKRSLETFGKKRGVEQRKLAFRGLDGNAEGREMAYAQYYYESDGGRFTDLEIEHFNSHMPMLATYRAMLSAWKESMNKHSLTEDDVRRILASA
jgi:uncharacterized protein